MPARVLTSFVDGNDPGALTQAIRRVAGFIDSPIASVRVELVNRTRNTTGSKSALVGKSTPSFNDRDVIGGGGGGGAPPPPPPPPDGNPGATGNLRLTAIDRVNNQFPGKEFTNDQRTVTGRWIIVWCVTGAIDGAATDVAPTALRGRILSITNNIYTCRSDDMGVCEFSTSKTTGVGYVHAYAIAETVTGIDWTTGAFSPVVF